MAFETTPSSCSVLIVGAGPVGLFLALKLKQQGVDVVVVDRQPVRYPLPRAVAFDHEARRSVNSIGLEEEIGVVLQDSLGLSFDWIDAELNTIVYTGMEERKTVSGYPSFMSFHQPDLEGLLEKTVLERGIPLLRNYNLESLQDHGKQVEATFAIRSPKSSNGINGVNGHACMNNTRLNNGDACTDTIRERKTFTCQYLVGCDGANSTVRDLIKMDVTKLDFEEDWLVIDLIISEGAKLPPLIVQVGAGQVCDPARPTTIAPSSAGRKRMEFMRLPGESRADLLKDEKVWELLKRWGWNQTDSTIERKVVYTFNARWANQAYKGNVFLAGDSLHLMPPFIGQGLNSGLRDAVALGWRIPLALRKRADPAVLKESYSTERLSHVIKLTHYCILMGKAICELDPATADKIHAGLRANPPTDTFDPPLGRSSLLTSQSMAGHLCVQRQLQRPGSQESIYFDNIHGYGWMLLNLGKSSAERHLKPMYQELFQTILDGKMVSILPEEDTLGEYATWFKETTGDDQYILVRPDFYIYGHCSKEDLDDFMRDFFARLQGSV